MPLIQDLKEQNNHFQATVLKNDTFEKGHLEHLKRLDLKYFIEPILDIGCGQGLALDWLRGLGKEDLTGIDLSEDMVAVARHRGIYAEVMDIQTHPFYNRKFGTVICVHTLEHILDLTHAALHMSNICDKYLIIIVPKETVSEMNHNHLHVNIFTNSQDVAEFFPDFDLILKGEDKGDLILVFEKRNV